MHSLPLLEDFSHETVKRGAIALDVARQIKPLPRRQHCNTMVSNCTIYQHLIAWLGTVAADNQIMFNNSDTGGVNENPVCLSSRHHLGITGNNGNSCPISSFAHGIEDLFQFVSVEPLFHYQPDTQIQRSRSHHGKVIDRSVHRKATDIASRKKNRIDDI